MKEKAPVDPTDRALYMDKVEIMYNLARLSFETDSTRAITLMLDSVDTPALTVPGATITDGYHNLSHHGRSEDKRGQLKALDEAHMKLLAKLFTSLKAVREGGRDAAGSDDGLLRLEPGRRQQARDHERPGDLRRRRLQARAAPRVRQGEELPAGESLRVRSRTDGNPGRQVCHLHRHAAQDWK